MDQIEKIFRTLRILSNKGKPRSHTRRLHEVELKHWRNKARHKGVKVFLRKKGASFFLQHISLALHLSLGNAMKMCKNIKKK